MEWHRKIVDSSVYDPTIRIYTDLFLKITPFHRRLVSCSAMSHYWFLNPCDTPYPVSHPSKVTEQIVHSNFNNTHKRVMFLCQVSESGLERVSVTSIPLEAPVSSHSHSPREDRLVLACNNGVVALHSHASTHLTRAALCPARVAWLQPGALVAVANDRGQVGEGWLVPPKEAKE